ncbi:bifunctional tail protein [Escherichia coli HVH 91 (4-4638751)]|uniref:phage tailspike protein n=1 Tax=Escherichia coli TaxID=562 RepID=UPI00038F3E69|nr:phage tailspike protein [Escherichia coli]EQQ12399.1 bifunctional tail protein [Escherichia coli HVH 91 (4-4638751)]
MTDITANVVVSMPSQLFTMARSFKAVANGKIYIGKIDTDPVNPENQIPVYLEREDGKHVQVEQPIVINSAGYPVYNGQIAKFVTVQGHSMAVYDAYGAQQFYFPNVLKYDPDQFKYELSSSLGSGMVGVQPIGTLYDQSLYVTPEQFGAVGDGVNDDTESIVSAMKYCSSGKIRWVRGKKGSTYLVSQVEIPVGIKKISDLSLIVTAQGGVCLFSQGTSGHTDLEISDCSINANGVARGGILLSATTRCKILRNRVYGFGVDGTERYGIRIGTTDITSLNLYDTIEGNTIEMPIDPDSGAGTVGIAGIYLVAQNNIDTETGSVKWNSQHKTIQYITVSNNTVINGTHNVQAFGLFNAEFTGNILIGGSHRNINLGTGCERVKIEGNRLINAESSAIIFGESRYIQISNNYIQSASTSSYISDDAAIQFAQGAYSIDIIGNMILGDWRYGVHCFNSRYVSLKNNTITASVACIGIESSQTLKLPDNAIYSSRRSVTKMINGSTTEYSISGNVYTPNGDSACAIYLCQLNGVVLGNINIYGETIHQAGNFRHILYLVEDDSLMTGISAIDISAKNANYSQYYSIRGRTPFYKIDNVTALEDPSIEYFAPGGTSSAFVGPSIYLDNKVVSYFSNGIDGQIIQVRMSIGSKLIHNNKLIRLRGEKDIASISGNTIITLKRLSGIWFEISRSI